MASEKSFSRAAEQMLRTQPAISLAVQKLGSQTRGKAHRSLRQGTAAHRRRPLVFDYARRFENLSSDLENALAELRDNSAGRLIMGANESYVALLCRTTSSAIAGSFPKVKVQVRRILSSKIPSELIDGDLELGVISYDPEDERLIPGDLHRSPGLRRFAQASPGHACQVSISELGMETFIAHYVLSPYRDVVIKRIPAAPSPAQHGSGDADDRVHPPHGPAQ